MDAKHLNKPDPRPKHRISRDNPYRIYTIGIDTDSPQYFVTFRDESGQEICCEVSEKVYSQFEVFELEDIRYMNERERHYEKYELSELEIERRSVGKQEDIDDIVSQHLIEEKLHNAVQTLPELQRERIIRHYYLKETYQSIANRSGCTVMPVQRSICAAQKNIRKFMKNGAKK